jgi:teichuronic acid biosynthesis glycosyltransferase TuaG
MPTPLLISIIMPSFNCALTIGEAIESIINQTYPNWELIISDDSSTDNTANVVKSYLEKDERIQFLSNPVNLGVSAMRNIALEASKGAYICFLDADDAWPAHKLRLQLDFMKKHSSIISVGYFMDVDAMNTATGYIRTCPAMISYDYLLKNNCVLFQTMMANATIKSWLHFEPIKHEDFILALSLLQKPIRFDVIPTVLAYRRRQPKSLTSNKLKSAHWRWHVYRKTLNLSRFMASWYMLNYAMYMVYFKFDHHRQKLVRVL